MRNVVHLMILMLILMNVGLYTSYMAGPHIDAEKQIRTTGVDGINVIAKVPFDTAEQVYVFEDGYAVCNGTYAYISYDGHTAFVNATKLLYLPKYNMLVYSAPDGIYKLSLSDFSMLRLLSGSVDGFWISAGQNILYAWRNTDLYVIDFSGFVKAQTSYDFKVKTVIPYGYDYWLFVATTNGTHWSDYIYSDARTLKLQYTRTREVTEKAFFIDWGGDKTLVFANTTHLIFWRTYYDTTTVYDLPTTLSNVDLFQAMSFWSYSAVISGSNIVIMYTRAGFYTYYFTANVSYAKMYVGMRTWGSDYPWLVIASCEGIKIVYRDPDTDEWTMQIIYENPVCSDIFIDDLDLDGAEEFYFVYDGQLICVEIEQVQYTYSYRAVIPSIYFWAGHFLLYDRSAKDWDNDGLSNTREVDELQTSLLRTDTDNDDISDYEEVYTTKTNPVKNDSDTDGLSDGYELYVTLTNPTKADSDDDELLDGEELKLGTNPLDADSDDDGLTDWQEVKVYKTNPNDADTDGDGLNDGDEIFKYKTDALKQDTDGDKLTDYEEVNTFHTNPLDKDTDNDGLSDYDEVMVYDTNPLNDDTDGDKFSDSTEVRLGFNPNDKADNPSSGFAVLRAFWWAFLATFMIAFALGMFGLLFLVHMVERRKTAILSL